MKNKIYEHRSAPAALIICFLLISACTPGSGGTETSSGRERVRAAIYAGEGVGEAPYSPADYASLLKSAAETISPGITCGLIDLKAIERGDLDRYHVIVFPGGVAGTVFRGLGQRGRTAVKSFVNKGGGFVGICAGAYMGQTREPGTGGGTLALSSAAVLNRGRNWARGAGIIEVEVTPEGAALFPELRAGGRYFMHYNNGPVMIQPSGMEGSSPRALMRFVSDVYHGAPGGRGESPGKIFLHESRHGRGRVLLMSGHPEMTPGFKWMLPRMIESAAGREPSPYAERFVQPGKYSREILFDRGWSISEARNYSILRASGGAAEAVRVRALGDLTAMASRGLCGRFPSLLRESSPAVRGAAASAAAFYDCFSALPALKTASALETDPGAFKSVNEAIKSLSP